MGENFQNRKWICWWGTGGGQNDEGKRVGLDLGRDIWGNEGEEMGLGVEKVRSGKIVGLNG